MVTNTILITQARLGSSRLPGKVLKEINNTPLLQIHLERLKACKNVTEILVATTTNSSDKIIYNKAKEWGFNAFQGSELNVLDRFYQAVKHKNVDWVVRVTSDCPLLDPNLVDDVISFAQNNQYDYVSNGLIEQYPDGQDVEVFKFSALELAWKNAKLESELEHVTPFIRSNANARGLDLFNIANFPCAKDYSKIRMTVDEPQDFEVIKHLIEKLGTKKNWLEYTNYMIDNELTSINAKIIRNEGYIKSLEKDKNG